MAFAGTVTFSKQAFGTETILHVAIAGFDADAEDSSTIDEIDFFEHPVNRWPRRFQWWASRTAGATDVVSVKLYGKPDDGASWVELGEITGVSGTNPTQSTITLDPEIDWGEPSSLPLYRYIKVISATVGAGNTLSVYIDCIPEGI